MAKQTLIITDDIRTYEDVEELHAAEGWGCKCCGWLSSDAWWQSSGDRYCTRCKKALWNELRVSSVKYPTRKEAGITAAPLVPRAYNPASEGHAYAAWARADYDRIHHNVIDGEVVTPRQAIAA